MEEAKCLHCGDLITSLVDIGNENLSVLVQACDKDCGRAVRAVKHIQEDVLDLEAWPLIQHKNFLNPTIEKEEFSFDSLEENSKSPEYEFDFSSLESS